MGQWRRRDWHGTHVLLGLKFLHLLYERYPSFVVLWCEHELLRELRGLLSAQCDML